MIKIDNVETPSGQQWEAVIRGCRNPFNSWDRMDSDWKLLPNGKTEFKVGKNDLTLMHKLANAGDDHGKFMRMLPVLCDITAPFYWWKQMDQYKLGTVTNSCSTMHRLMAKEFELDDFSFEHAPTDTAVNIVKMLNGIRSAYMTTKDEEKKKELFNMTNELLPQSYNQTRTWSANYQVLRHIYHARKNHKLGDWHTFCGWIETLPYAKELILGEMDT